MPVYVYAPVLPEARRAFELASSWQSGSRRRPDACEVLIREVLATLVLPHLTDDVFPWALERIRQYTLNEPSL